MGISDDLIALERRGWQALSSSGDDAARFYEEILDEEVAMLLPGGLLLTDRDEILRAMSGAPWSSFALEDPQVLQPVADIGVVLYGVVATRAGSPDYSALISSAYVRRDGAWRLALHQQTPR